MTIKMDASKGGETFFTMDKMSPSNEVAKELISSSSKEISRKPIACAVLGQQNDRTVMGRV